MKTKRYRATLAYDGTRYAGFQRQAPGTLTVQGVVEQAIGRITQQAVTIKGAGRTDAGVHASGQVIAFDCEWRHPTENLWRAVNAKLPSDIALKTLDLAPDEFHPRFDARSRRYEYLLYTAPVRNPLRDRYWWHVGQQALAHSTMQQAADLLIGVHDFAAFGQPTQGDVTIRELYEARLDIINDGDYALKLEASGFLRQMVRRITGSLVDIGQGRWTLNEFSAAFTAADLSQSGQLAPPNGLTLTKVKYD